jgi:O-antigen/teichoic acid export membrane protein
MNVLNRGNIKITGRGLVAKSFVAFFVRVVGAFASFGLTFVVAKLLNIEQAGLYFLAFSMVNILSAVARAGMDNTLVRFGGGWPELLQSAFKKSLVLSGVLSVLLGLLVHYFAAELANYVFGKPKLEPILQAFSFSILGVSWFTLVSYGLQGAGRIVASIVTLSIATNVIVSIFIVLTGVDVAYLVSVAFAVTTIAVAVIGISYFWMRVGQLPNVSAVSWSELRRSFIPLWLVVVMGQFIQWSPPFLAGIFIGAESIAILTVALKTAMLISFILVSVNMVVAPRVARLSAMGEMSEVNRIVSLTVRLTIIVSSPVIVIFLVFPHVILGFFGAEFVTSGKHLLQILAVAQFVNVVTGPAGMILTMSGKEGYVRRSVFYGFFVTLVTIPLFAYIAGLVGAGIGAALGIFTQNIMACYYLNAIMNINIYRCIWGRG